MRDLRSKSQRSLWRPIKRGILFFTLLTFWGCDSTSKNLKSVEFQSLIQNGEIQGTLHLDKIMTTPGETIRGEIKLEAPTGSHIELSLDSLKKFETIDFQKLPVTIHDTGKEIHQFNFIFQVGAPEKIPAQKIMIELQTKSQKKAISVELPEITIKSAFPSGKSTGKLPDLEENDFH